MTEITFYRYNGDRNVINKNLTDGLTSSGEMFNTVNVLNPTVILRGSDFDYNYCHIPDLKRYYFIDNVTVTSGKITLELVADPLKTYESEILSATATATESDTPDKYVSTRDTVFNRKPNFERVQFPNTDLLSSDGSLIMVTIKGTK